MLATSSSVQVLIAALNEEEGIGLVIAELQRSLHYPKIVVVDGHSTDGTVAVARKLGAETYYQEGTGKGDALAKAVEHIDPDAKYIVVTDADYTYPTSQLEEMIQLLDENPDVGMICGNRFNGEVDKKALREIFFVGNRLICFAHNFLNGIQLEDPLTGLRVIRAEILRGWKPESKGFDIEVELNHHVERLGYGILEVPIQYRPRLGEKKLKARHGAVILRRILIETVKPTSLSDS